MARNQGRNGLILLEDEDFVALARIILLVRLQLQQ